jgi:hypothetical protein
MIKLTPKRHHSAFQKFLAMATLVLPASMLLVHSFVIKGISQRESALPSVHAAAAYAKTNHDALAQWAQGEMTFTYAMVALSIITTVLALLSMPIAYKLWRIGRQSEIERRAQLVMEQCNGGVFKRIDENRELLELLQARAPKFLEDCFWVEGWLQQQDEFLNALSQTVPAPNARFNPARMPPGVFPRPWPIDAKPGSTEKPDA